MSSPHGPRSPELWQQLRWLATPFSFMRDSRHRYGESFTIAIGKGKLSKVVFVSHPKDLELILSNDDGELFDARRTKRDARNSSGNGILDRFHILMRFVPQHCGF